MRMNGFTTNTSEASATSISQGLLQALGKLQAIGKVGLAPFWHR